MSHFIYRFVYGLKSEIGDMIKQHMLFWQNKPIDEVLRYAKYCSDDIEAHRQLKERTMWAQVKMAKQQEAILKKDVNTGNQGGQKQQ